jgi:small-conductance mechanosensitive channel
MLILHAATGITAVMNILLKAALGIFFAFIVQASSQEPTPIPTPTVSKDYHQLLDAARQAGVEEFQKQQPATPEEYREYVHLLTKLVEAQSLTEEWGTAAMALEKQASEVRQAVSDFKPPEITPESGLLLFDTARVNDWQAEDWLEALNKIGSTRDAQESTAFVTLKNQQQKLQVLEAAGPTASPRDAWVLELQRTRVQATLAEHSLRSDKRSWQADVDLQQALIQLAKLNISSLAGRVSFPENLLQAKLEEVQKAEDKLTDSLTKVGKQVKKPASENSTQGNKDIANLLAESMENQLQLFEYQRIGLTITGQVWQSRYDLWNTKNAMGVEEIARLLNDKSQDVQAWQPLIIGLRSKLQDRWRKASLALEANEFKAQPNLADAVDKAFQQEESVLSDWENGFSALLELIKLTTADLGSKRKSLGLGEKMDAAATSLTTQAHNLWNTEIFTLNDSVFVNGQLVQRPSSVTLGMLSIALGILIVGGLASAAFSRWLRSRLSERFSLDATTGAIVQKFTHILLLGIICLIALALVKIPLTIFALLGGGAAIAVGFGAQQLVNNLISGIILLFERPIRIGDVIEVETFAGLVTAIGTRCCQLRRIDGVEILIPNSVILQNTVVNWTLSNRHARQDFRVGIAHGAPLQKAIRIVQDIVTAHGEVLKDRRVEVFLQDFQRDSLILCVFYWIDKTNPRTANAVPGELRLAIYEAFQAEGILLALPQREVHLDTATPLSIQIMPPTK